MSARRRTAGHLVLACDMFGCDSTYTAQAWMNGPAEVRYQARTEQEWRREMRQTPLGYRHFDICGLHAVEAS